MAPVVCLLQDKPPSRRGTYARGCSCAPCTEARARHLEHLREAGRRSRDPDVQAQLGRAGALARHGAPDDIDDVAVLRIVRCDPPARMTAAERREGARRLWRSGHSIRLIAETVGVRERQVWRYLGTETPPGGSS